MRSYQDHSALPCSMQTACPAIIGVFLFPYSVCTFIL
jgi:hypothetical protein